MPTPLNQVSLSPVQRRSWWILLLIFICLLFLVGLFFVYRNKLQIGGIGEKDQSGKPRKERMIQEEVVLPQTSQVTPTEGQYFAHEGVAVPLVPPADEEIVLPRPSRTIKAAYTLAEPAALRWAPDARLHFIRSLSTVTPKGDCSVWQIIFASQARQRGYEVLIEGNDVRSVKEIASTSPGAELPRAWYDSDEAVQSIANLPQFASSTLSGLTFFYNQDAQEWRYGIATTFGNTSMRVK